MESDSKVPVILKIAMIGIVIVVGGLISFGYIAKENFFSAITVMVALCWVLRELLDILYTR